MNWILIITFVANTTPSVIQVNSFNEWICGVMIDGIKEKTITLNDYPLTIQKAECKQIK